MQRDPTHDSSKCSLDTRHSPGNLTGSNGASISMIAAPPTGQLRSGKFGASLLTLGALRIYLYRGDAQQVGDSRFAKWHPGDGDEGLTGSGEVFSFGNCACNSGHLTHVRHIVNAHRVHHLG